MANANSLETSGNVFGKQINFHEYLHIIHDISNSIYENPDDCLLIHECR